jgi:hypothetical protein
VQLAQIWRSCFGQSPHVRLHGDCNPSGLHSRVAGDFCSDAHARRQIRLSHVSLTAPDAQLTAALPAL